MTRLGFPVVCPQVWWETCAVPNKPGQIIISKEPWGEATWVSASMSVRRIRVAKIRFLTPEIALVDALSPGPLLIVLKKQGTDWKIASLRRLTEN